MNRAVVLANQKPALTEACDTCSATDFKFLFSKDSAAGIEYGIYECARCGLVQTLPRPTEEELEECYGAHYFQRRTDRGYDNYFSDAMRTQLQKVWDMNLQDVGFFQFEKLCLDGPGARALDVGCASGFFVDYLNRRGWQAEGIELSQAAAGFGIDELGLTIHVQDFLDFQPSEPYDFISLWASIEHLRSPLQAMRKISAMLRPGGMLVLSTCRWGLLSRSLGPSWRFLNVPEHLFYFSRSNLVHLARQFDLKEVGSITYGSGFTAFKGMGFFYRTAKALADRAVKFVGLGDMMVYAFRKDTIER